MTNFASNERKTIIYFILIGFFILLTIRLIQMQIIEAQVYDEKSAGNSIKAIEQTPLRGVFYDRNLQLLVSNTPAYTLRITPAEYDRSLNPLLETVLGVDSGFVNRLLFANRIYSRYMPIRVRRGVDFKVISWVEENREHLSGVDYIVEMQRDYSFGIMGSHVLGYSKEISPTQLAQERDFYIPGDYVGFTGIEKTYEKYLRGVKGYNYVLVDSRRREIGKFRDGESDVSSEKGHDLVLGIDLELQKIAEESLKGKSGGIVAIDPQTGEILAMASAPDFDLVQFSYGTSREFLNQLANNPLRPQFNRATMGAHPPGSTYKMLSALAALDMGIINENSTIFCGGGFTFGRFFKCLGTHGSISVRTAIEKSCNAFFYQLVLRIGLEKFAEYSRNLGFGRKIGVDILEEATGLIPDEKYYERIYGKNWPRGILVSLGVGQGEVNVTPLQLAYYTALLANKGKTFVPHVVKGYLDDYTKEIIPFKFDEVKLNIKEHAFDIVREGMYLVVNGNGTARSLKMEDFIVSGKTGTAQNPHGKDHALFVGFAPYDKPTIAIAVIVENVGFGGTHAAPIAKKMFESYLRRDNKKESKEKLIINNLTHLQGEENEN